MLSDRELEDIGDAMLDVLKRSTESLDRALDRLEAEEPCDD